MIRWNGGTPDEHEYSNIVRPFTASLFIVAFAAILLMGWMFIEVRCATKVI